MATNPYGDPLNLNTIMGPKPTYPAPAPRAAAPAAAPSGNGVFWKGADGKVYVKGGSGTNSAGAWDANTANYWSSRGFAQINDPNPPRTSTASAAPGYSSGSGGGAPNPNAKDANITLLNSQLNANDDQTNKGVAQIEAALSKVLGEYGTDATANEDTYKSSSDQNTNNLLTQKETALTNAVQGRRGLFGELASLGALNGSGIDLANRAVQRGANEDLSGATDTYKGNQTNLDSAIGAFRRENEQRKADATDAATNAKQSTRNSGLKTKQQILTNLANDYDAEGNSAMRDKYIQMASALSGQIADTGVPAALPTYTAAAFTAPTLSNYLGNSDTTVSTAPSNGQGVPGLFAGGFLAPNKKKS